MKSTLKVATTAWSWDALGTADALCQQAEQAEALGFHSFWLPENHFGERALPAPLMLLAAIAARTSTLRLGCTSYLLPIRNPLLAAEEVAVLDQLSGGRLILGVGRGIQPEMFQAFAVPVSDKRKLFAHNLEIMRAAWRGEAILEDGRGAPVCLSPLPVQRPEPLIWVAAFGPLALRQVAGLGLPYLASPIETLDTLDANYRSFHDMVRESGQPVVDVVPVMRTVFVTQSQAETAEMLERVKRTLPARLRQADTDAREWAIVGEKEEVAEQLARYRERLAMTLLILRAGIPGVSDEEQLRSHAAVLELVN